MADFGLRIIGLKKTYPKTFRRPAVEAVKGVDLDVRRGEVVALLGPNGAGKTTALKAMCGLLRPDGGEIHIGPYNLARHQRRALAHMAVVLEGDRNLRWRLNARENIIFFTRLAGCNEARVRRELPAAVERFGLTDKLKTQVRQLSKGQKQKLSVCIAYLTRADLALLDEPTLGLDVSSSLELQAIIREMADEGRAVLLTTHEMTTAQRVADRVAIINQGRIVTFKPTAALLELFRYRQYEIRLRWADGASAAHDLPEGPDLKLVGDGDGYSTMELATDAKERLYELLDQLRHRECDILEVARHQPDLEKVFLEVVSGGEPPRPV
jgi:ABC-2 type transport system ATP-binding protein